MCNHEPLVGPSTDADGNELQYFSRYEPTFKELQKLVMDQQWLKSMKYYIKFRSVLYYLSTTRHYFFIGTLVDWSSSIMFSWRMHLSVQLSSKDLLRLYLILVNVLFGVAQNKF